MVPHWGRRLTGDAAQGRLRAGPRALPGEPVVGRRARTQQNRLSVRQAQTPGRSDSGPVLQLHPGAKDGQNQAPRAPPAAVGPAGHALASPGRSRCTRPCKAFWGSHVDQGTGGGPHPEVGLQVTSHRARAARELPVKAKPPSETQRDEIGPSKQDRGAKGRTTSTLPKSPADLMSMLSKPLPILTMMRRALNFSRSSLVSVMVWYISAPTASFSTCPGGVDTRSEDSPAGP